MTASAPSRAIRSDTALPEPVSGRQLAGPTPAEALGIALKTVVSPVYRCDTLLGAALGLQRAFHAAIYLSETVIFSQWPVTQLIKYDH